MKRKQVIYTVVSLIIITLSFVFSDYLISNKPVPEKDAQMRSVVYVKAAQAEVSTIKTSFSYRGRLTAFDQVSLASEVQGKIIQGDVRFKTGERFQKGDILLLIYKDDILATMKSGKAGLLQTLSLILPDIRVDYPDEYEKWNAFFRNIAIDKPLPELPELNSEKEKVFMAANNVLSTYYSLQQQEINLQRYAIAAPFDGVFKNVYKEIGAIASPGAELATLLRTDKLEVTVPVFPADLGDIEVGQSAEISNDSDEQLEAKVSRISGFVDEATQSVNVYLTFKPGKSHGFLPGAYVDVYFEGSALMGFEIPREALFDGSCVYALEDSKLVKTKVNIIRQLNDSYVISGMQPGTTIVTESLASINPEADYLVR